MDIARQSFEDFPDAGSGETVLVVCDTPGEPCDDGNSCTVNDTCIGKICFGQLMACQDSSSCPDNNCPFYYSSSSRQEISVYDEENTEHKIMEAELIISLRAGSFRGDAKRLAGLVEGIIVGQVPSYGLYLVELGSGDISHMDTSMDILVDDESVKYVSYNGIPEAAGDPCPGWSNNFWLDGREKCPWLDTNYFPALRLFNAVYPNIVNDSREPPVRVAVIETRKVRSKENGFYLSHPKLAHLKKPGRVMMIGEASPSPLQDLVPDSPHGTQVLGVLAAKNNEDCTDDCGVSGVLSDFLGERYVILLGMIEENFQSFAKTVAVSPFAQVVNLSWHSNVVESHCKLTQGFKFEDYYEEIEQAFRNCPLTLFVCSAPNKPDLRLKKLIWPAGLALELENVVSVGGSASCEPYQMSTNSSYGERVEMLAPADSIPALFPTNTYKPENGNSFAAPQVAGLAAVLAEISGDKAEALYYRMLLGNKFFPVDPEGPDISHPVIDFYQPLAYALYEKALSKGANEALNTMDPCGYGFPWPPLLSAMILCDDRLTYMVDGFGTHQFEATDYCVFSDAFLYVYDESMDLSVALAEDEGDWNLDINCIGTEFDVGTNSIYPLADTEEAGTCTLRLMTPQTNDWYGYATVGSLHMEFCEVDEREPDTNLPRWLSVEGKFEGAITMINGVTNEEQFTTISTEDSFRIRADVDSSVSEEIFARIEEKCFEGQEHIN